MIEDLTLEENVYLLLKIAKSKNAEQKVKSLLKTFGIDALSRKKPNEISGGESQKAAIARAMANNPSVMLADEPTASLDSESFGIVVDAFKMIRENFGTTIVGASHDSLPYDHIQKKYFLFDGMLKTRPKRVWFAYSAVHQVVQLIGHISFARLYLPEVMHMCPDQGFLVAFD